MNGLPTTLPVPSAVKRGSLRDGLLMCLALLESDPERFERAAVVWHRRWCSETPGIRFCDSRATLDALESLTHADPLAAIEALRTACADIEGVDAVLDEWLAKRSG